MAAMASTNNSNHKNASSQPCLELALAPLTLNATVRTILHNPKSGATAQIQRLINGEERIAAIAESGNANRTIGVRKIAASAGPTLPRDATPPESVEVNRQKMKPTMRALTRLNVRTLTMPNVQIQRSAKPSAALQG